MNNHVEQAHKFAKEILKQSIAQQTNVSVCIVGKKNDQIVYFPGANLENKYKKTNHAEEVALIQGLMAGFRGLDFKFMVQPMFRDKHIYPACLSCLAFLYEYTHPDFIIYVTNSKEEVVYQKTLKELVSGFGGEQYIYPSINTRMWD